MLCVFTLASDARAADFIVTKTADSGAGSLRQAITSANQTPGPDTIKFNIPGSGIQIIALQSALPLITEQAIIDGYTQPGSAANTLSVGTNAVILIQLDGAAAGQSAYGFSISADGCIIKGLSITRFDSNGIGMFASDNKIISGNFIGVDALGRAEANGVSFGNNSSGVQVAGGTNNLVGGTTPAARNIISNNSSAAISVGSSATATRIEGNLIGTNAAATAVLHNGTYAIVVNSPNTTVGGAASGAGNVISSNNECIRTIENNSNSATVQGNFIGTDPTGTRDLGCNGNGVSIAADNAIVGGEQASARNVIAFNKGVGVRVTADAQNARILGNSIYKNTSLGINLDTDGVTPNDIGDPDTGANNLQNFPVIQSATTNATTVIGATLNSENSKPYRFEFFASPTCDTNGYGEGRMYLGFASTNTNNQGIAIVNNFLTSIYVPVGSYITGTATDMTRNETSEFSFCKQVTGNTGAQTLPPSEDAHVRGAEANANFGKEILLQVKRTLNPGSGKGRQAYLRFDLSRITHSGGIAQATLRVYGRLSQVAGANMNIPAAVFPVTETDATLAAWTENTLTWTTKLPPDAPQPLAQVVVTDAVERWYEFDVTAFVNGKLNANSRVVGFIIRNMAKGEAGDYFTQFNSREAAANQPQLVVVQ